MPPIPDCIRRLLPPLPTLVEFRKTEVEWTINGAQLVPYFCDEWNSLALCDIQDYRPPEYQDQGEVWISVEILQRALQLAEQLGITAVSLTEIEVCGKPSPVIALVGWGSETAIVVAPRLEKVTRKKKEAPQ